MDQIRDSSVNPVRDLWHEGPLAVLDLETTGTDPATARIVELSFLLVDPDGKVEPLVDTLVNPGIPIPPEASAVSGITTADLIRDGRDPGPVLNETVSSLGRVVEGGVPILIFNATYDWPLLGFEFARLGCPALPDVPPAILVDPLVLDRHCDRYRRGKRDLASMAIHYGVDLKNAHRAGGDAMATVEVARAMVARYGSILDLDGPGLVKLQKQAHERWRVSFNEYLVSRGEERRLVTEVWPGV